MDIMFYEAFDEEARSLAQILPSHIDVGFTRHTIQASLDEEPPAPVISVRTQSTIPEQWSEKLRGVLSRSAGYDHLKRFREQTRSSAVLGYLEDYCSRAVAEQATLLMLSLFRGLPKQIAQFDMFHRDGLTGKECRGRTLLVVGVGKIGKECVDLGRALGMTVLGVDIVHRHEGVEYVELRDGIQKADVIICCAPLTDKTRGMLGSDVLSLAPKGTCLVNIARGEITPFEDMVELFDKGILQGAAFDVFPDEEILSECLRNSIFDHPSTQKLQELRRFENVILTPHNAFNTEEALRQKCVQSVRSLELFLQSGTFAHMVQEER